MCTTKLEAVPPVAAGEEQLLPGRQVVGARNVPRVRRQGQGVAVHAYSRGVHVARTTLQPLLGRTVWSAVSLAESAAFVAYEASSAVSALEAWSAVMLASRLASCAATKASVAGICYFGVYLQWRVQSVHRGEQGGQRACVRLAEEGGVQGRRGDRVQEV